jgi:hypothetical protein
MGKLTYEQMRHLAELGDGPGKLTIKNRAGKVLRPALKKWGEIPRETRSMFSAAPPRQNRAPTGHLSRIYQQASC